MKASTRWGVAQEYEKKHWKKKSTTVASGHDDLGWYEWKARRTLKRMAEHGVRPRPDGTVAEIGSGPVGQVAFLPFARRLAFDPLMAFFDGEEVLVRRRPAGVEYAQAKGESLPLEAGTCDLVVIENCIDHCENPQQVIAECRRILKPGGVLYLTVNVRSRAGAWIRSSLELLLPADPGHPHSYHERTIRELVGGAGLDPVGTWREGFLESVASNWKDSRLRTAVKVSTLTLERLFEGLWRRE